MASGTHERDAVLDDRLSDAEATQALDPRKLAKAGVLEATHRQGLAHVARGEVIGSEHAKQLKFFERIDGYSTTKIIESSATG